MVPSLKYMSSNCDMTSFILRRLFGRRPATDTPHFRWFTLVDGVPLDKTPIVDSTVMASSSKSWPLWDDALHSMLMWISIVDCDVKRHGEVVVRHFVPIPIWMKKHIGMNLQNFSASNNILTCASKHFLRNEIDETRWISSKKPFQRFCAFLTFLIILKSVGVQFRIVTLDAEQNFELQEQYSTHDQKNNFLRNS